MKQKRLPIYLAALLLTASLAGLLSFGAQAGRVGSGFLRLHVIAASDAPEDQQRKLAVRDAVLRAAESLCGQAAGKEQAAAALRAGLDDIRHAAQRQLTAVGGGQQVRVFLEQRYFPRKAYADITLPAGRYDALCVEIGPAEGQNWWCIAYPPLCLPAARASFSQEQLRACLTDEEYDLLRNPVRYKARFAVVELLKKLFGGVSGK